MPTYTRGDVYTRSGHPAVNVKCRGWWPGSHTDEMLRSIAAENGHDPERFAAWWHATEDADDIGERWLQPWWDAVAEDAWEQFQECADDIFPSAVQVYSEGRSGGWLVVHGLPDIDSWDAIALSRWRRFERLCRSLCDETYVAERITELVLINRYEAETTAAESLAAELDAWFSLAPSVV